MKKYITGIMLPMLALLMGACDKETEGLTWTTYYPQMTLDGSTYVNWQAGVPYVDPGISVLMNGEDVTADVLVTTTMDLDNPKPGYYTIDYSYITADGITAVASRQIIVAGTDGPLAGFYFTTDNCYYVEDGENKYWTDSRGVQVVAYDSDCYTVNDMLGYSMQFWYNSWDAFDEGYIYVAPDGTVQLLGQWFDGWGLDYLLATFEGSYDAATETFIFDEKPYWGSSPNLHVELKK